MKINIMSDNIFGFSGFSAHARNLSNALYKINPEVSIETPVNPQEIDKIATTEEKQMLRNRFQQEINVMITNPLAWLMKVSDRPKASVGFAIFEGSRIPTAFIEASNKVDLLLAPSQHVIDAFKPFTNVPIKLVPHGVNPEVFYPKSRDLVDEKMKVFRNDNKLTFIWNKGWSKGEKDRSGLDIALKAFSEEFKKDEKVRFLIHINPVYNMPGWDIGKEIEKLNLPKDRAEIIIITSLMPNEHLNDLYNLGDIYVTISKAEGYNLPCIEAMACGKPCIASNYGGHVDFINDKNGWLVNGTMVPASDPDVQYEMTNWYQCDINHLRKIMRHCFDNREEVRQKGEEAYKTSKEYTWDNSAKRLIEALNSLSLNNQGS